MNFATQINFARQSFVRLTALAIAAWPTLALAQAEGLRPMRGLRQTSFWEQNWPWLTAVITAALVALIILTAWLIRRKPAAQLLSPADEARLRLGEAVKHAQNGQDKAFSVAVSDALRGYLERAFGLRAPEQTTEEFLQSAKSSKQLPEPSLATLAHFLELCDLAKFAQHAFGDEERQDLLNTARNFVDEAENKTRAPSPKAEAVAT